MQKYAKEKTMNINPLTPNIFNILTSEPTFSKQSDEVELSFGSFADVLNDSMKTAIEADAADKVSAVELLIGKSDDLSGLLLDAQKAEISLNLALQIRNKVIDAYTEIMRMSV